MTESSSHSFATSHQVPKAMSPTNITHLSSASDLDAIISKSKAKLTVIDFHATWCGPCHAIAPAYESLSKQYPNVNFLKCDVDVATDVASRYSISAMPTFIFLKGNEKVDQVRGANRTALQDAVRRHSATTSSGVFSGKGQTLGGKQAPIDRVDVGNVVNQATSKVTDLSPQVKIFLGLAGAYVLFWYLS
ncbi:thioredoxin-domain-containing protein [Tricholoma matsutake]|nr:thioredoxin-domain-containing protein [Tricholoma matsutake 945]